MYYVILTLIEPLESVSLGQGLPKSNDYITSHNVNFVLWTMPNSQLNNLSLQNTHKMCLNETESCLNVLMYENDEILEAVRTAELDLNTFWKLISKARKSQIRGVSAIRRCDERVVHELNEVLKAWVDYFTKIGRR